MACSNLLLLWPLQHLNQGSMKPNQGLWLVRLVTVTFSFLDFDGPDVRQKAQYVITVRDGESQHPQKQNKGTARLGKP